MEKRFDNYKTCEACETDFQPNHGKQRFCSATCRVANHKRGKLDTYQHQQETAQNLTLELDELKAVPTTRKEVRREINPAWQLLDQQVESQRVIYEEATDDLADVQAQLDALTSTRKGAYAGVFVGLAAVLLVMAMRYDTRRRNPLGMAFAVCSFIALCVVGLIGYHVGRHVHEQLLVDDANVLTRSDELEQEISTHKDQIRQTKQTLRRMETELSQVARYVRETSIIIDQVKQPEPQ